MYEISVVIPCSKHLKVLRALRAFEDQDVKKDFEVILVGDVSEIDSAKYSYPLVLIPCPEKHANFRRNKGVEVSKAPLVAFMDDDAAPMKSWLRTATSVDPTGNTIITGIEYHFPHGATSKLAYEISKNRISEGTTVHLNETDCQVRWDEVPFCNCVIPKNIFNKVGLPSVEIPWDMDDFEFCLRASKVAQFQNKSELKIVHDRYPNSIREWLSYKWKLRVRSGEKLITHPSVYFKIFNVWICALFPEVLFIFLLLLPVSIIKFFVTLCFLYLLLLLTQIPSIRKSVGLEQVPKFLLTIFALHVTTLVGVQVGLLRKIVSRIYMKAMS
jgi:hypothetical protein